MAGLEPNGIGLSDGLSPSDLSGELFFVVEVKGLTLNGEECQSR